MKKKLTLLSLFSLLALPIFAQNIFTAIQENDAAAVRYLICQKGGNLNARDDSGATPLINAVKSRQYRIVRMLVQKDVNVNLHDKAGNTALIIACQNAQPDDKTVSLLVHQYADLNLKNKNGTTALMAAVNANNATAVKTLLEYGADSQLKDRQKKTAIDYAKNLDNTGILNLFAIPQSVVTQTAK